MTESNRLSMSLSALFSYLVFSKKVKEYLFVFSEDIYYVAHPALDPFLSVDREIKRTLLSSKEQMLRVSFSEKYRFPFEETRPCDPDMLVTQAIEESDYCVFYFDDEFPSREEFFAFQYAKEHNKKALNLYRLEDIGKVFAL